MQDGMSSNCATSALLSIRIELLRARVLDAKARL
jgi:hypothetical protein